MPSCPHVGPELLMCCLLYSQACPTLDDMHIVTGCFRTFHLPSPNSWRNTALVLPLTLPVVMAIFLNVQLLLQASDFDECDVFRQLELDVKIKAVLNYRYVNVRIRLMLKSWVSRVSQKLNKSLLNMKNVIFML